MQPQCKIANLLLHPLLMHSHSAACSSRPVCSGRGALCRVQIRQRAPYSSLILVLQATMHFHFCIQCKDRLAH